MKIISVLFLVLVSFVVPLHAEEDLHEFYGRHLVLSFLKCDEKALCDEETLKEKMHEAAKASHVNILSSSHHHFKPSGMTQVLLLSESHASIHTYPEFRACFVDLFTCGRSFDMAAFERVLSSYLKPEKVSAKFIVRHEDHEEIAYTPSINLEDKL